MVISPSMDWWLSPNTGWSCWSNPTLFSRGPLLIWTKNWLTPPCWLTIPPWSHFGDPYFFFGFLWISWTLPKISYAAYLQLVLEENKKWFSSGPSGATWGETASSPWTQKRPWFTKALTVSTLAGAAWCHKHNGHNGVISRLITICPLNWP